MFGSIFDSRIRKSDFPRNRSMYLVLVISPIIYLLVNAKQIARIRNDTGVTLESQHGHSNTVVEKLFYVKRARICGGREKG